jgi:Tol biopolymer transport system component
LQRIAASGGPSQTLCAVNGTASGAWSRDGVIVFNQGTSTLFRVSSAGGQPVQLTRFAAGKTFHHFPSFLPDGRHVLFHVAASSKDVDGIYVVSLDTGESKRLLAADSGAIYEPRSEYLLFVRQGTLMAQSFDVKTLTLADEPLSVAEQVESAVYLGVLAFSVSDDGVLAYGVGSGRASLRMVWVDRQGKVGETVSPEANYRGLDLAPDGKRVVTHRHEGQGGDIWVTELSRGTTSRFTFDASLENSSPIWSPDASQIVFGSVRAGKWGLYLKSANGAGAEERLVESNVAIAPMSWSPDGQSIVYWVNDPNTQYDLWLVSLSGDRKTVPLLHTPFSESHGQVSPDGKWLAYYSNETGQTEVHVRPFPAGAGNWQVSTSGGVFPRWRGDGRELYYMERASSGQLMAVDVKSSGSAFEAGTPKELFYSGYINLTHVANYHTYAVSADGQHFLIPRLPNDSEATAAPIAVVLNWAAALKK